MTGAGDRDGTEADERATDAATDSGRDDSRDDTTGEREATTRGRTDSGVSAATGPTDAAESGESSAESSGESTDETTPLDPVPLGEPQGLDPAVRSYWVVGSVFTAIPLTAVVAIVALTLNGLVTPLPVGPIVAAVFLLAIVLGGVRSVLRYRSWEYVVREESLYLSRGVVTQVQTVVPYVRVQHIDTRRSALERVFGLASLVVYTAGSRGADVTVPGLTPERASALQSRLKRLAIESEEEDAV
jgi:membrane protein YdbS with pleckstrin-like domain